MTASAFILIAANLLPLAMAAGGSWGIKEILPLYWFESAIIGFFNIFKILLAQAPITGRDGRDPLAALAASGRAVPPRLLKLFGLGGRILLAGFFTVHFGMFMTGHAFFLFGLVLKGFAGEPDFELLPYLLSVKWGVAALAASHAASFFLNYAAGGERYRTSPAECMMQPYSRIVIMHVTILAGAFASALFRDTRAVMVVFLALKIFADLKAHLRERSGVPRGRGPEAGVPAGAA